MNYIFFGKSCDLNIGNGKTVSSVELVLKEHLLNNKIIYSNIQLNNIEYEQLLPENIMDVIEVDNAVILFDEIHAIIHKNHRITTTCKKHSKVGLCYELVELFRQVRKKNITTISTAQTFADVQFQLRTVMHQMIICEKFHIADGTFRKCQTDKCPPDHEKHYIKQTNYRTGEIVYIEPERYYAYYDSNEIVKGWI